MAVQYDGWSIVAQYRKCGKQGCKTCAEGSGHGPYYYGTKVMNGRKQSKYFGKQSPADGSTQDDTQENMGMGAVQEENEHLRAENKTLKEQVSSLQKQLDEWLTPTSANVEPKIEPLSVQPKQVPLVTPPKDTSTTLIQQPDSDGELTRAQVDAIWNLESEKTTYPDAVIQQAYQSYVNGLFGNTQDEHTRLKTGHGSRPYVCPFRASGRGAHRTFGSAERLVRTAVPWVLEKVQEQQHRRVQLNDKKEIQRAESQHRYERMTPQALKALQEKMIDAVKAGTPTGWTMSLHELEEQLSIVEEVLKKRSH